MLDASVDRLLDSDPRTETLLRQVGKMPILRRRPALAIVHSLFAGLNLAQVAAALPIVVRKACCGLYSSACCRDPRTLSLHPSNHLEPVILSRRAMRWQRLAAFEATR